MKLFIFLTFLCFIWTNVHSTPVTIKPKSQEHISDKLKNFIEDKIELVSGNRPEPRDQIKRIIQNIFIPKPAEIAPLIASLPPSIIQKIENSK